MPKRKIKAVASGFMTVKELFDKHPEFSQRPILYYIHTNIGWVRWHNYGADISQVKIISWYPIVTAQFGLATAIRLSIEERK